MNPTQSRRAGRSIRQTMSGRIWTGLLAGWLLYAMFSPAR